ncbi:MAG: hypothetical protein ACM3X1_03080 [Ignavibacteriales bacterium]
MSKGGTIEQKRELVQVITKSPLVSLRQKRRISEYSFTK